MTEAIVVALITGVCSMIAVWITSAKASRDMDAKLEKNQAVFEAIVTERLTSLQKRVEEHNQLITRTYELEKQSDIHKAEFNRINHRLDAVEKEVQK